MRATDALPCPFCGEQPTWTGKTIKCINEDCPAKPKTAWWVSLDLALKAWNARASLTQL